MIWNTVFALTSRTHWFMPLCNPAKHPLELHNLTQNLYSTLFPKTSALPTRLSCSKNIHYSHTTLTGMLHTCSARIILSWCNFPYFFSRVFRTAAEVFVNKVQLVPSVSDMSPPADSIYGARHSRWRWFSKQQLQIATAVPEMDNNSGNGCWSSLIPCKTVSRLVTNTDRYIR